MWAAPRKSANVLLLPQASQLHHQLFHLQSSDLTTTTQAINEYQQLGAQSTANSLKVRGAIHTLTSRQPGLTPRATLQMLPQRIVRTSALRNALAGARRAPIVQRRGYLPTQYSDKKVLDEKYPDPPSLTEAEDPGMVRDINRDGVEGFL